MHLGQWKTIRDKLGKIGITKANFLYDPIRIKELNLKRTVPKDWFILVYKNALLT